MERTTNMTEGKTVGLILKFAFPLLLTNIGQQLYMIADAAIVGRGVGVKALAAVGATDWSYWLIMWTVMGLTQGFATFVSREFGKQDYKAMNKTVAMSAVLCLIIGLTLTIVGEIAAKPLLVLLDTPEDIIGNAEIYLKTMIAGTLIVTAYNMAASVLRALGDGKTPLIAMIIAAVMNIGLDLLFVMVFEWNIFGAALASVLAQLFSFIFCLVQLKRISSVKLGKEEFRLDGRLIKNLILFGIPVAFQFIVIAVGGIILQSTINLQGSIFIAGYTAANKLYGLLESTAISLGMAFSTFFAQNYGAGKLERVRNGVRTGAVMCSIAAVIVGIIMAVFGKYLLMLFIDSTEAGAPEALEIAFRYILIMALCLIILYLLYVYRNAVQAMGNSFWSMISGFAEFAVRVVMGKVFVGIFGSETLFYIEPVAWLGALLLIMVPYYVHFRRRLINE